VPGPQGTQADAAEGRSSAPTPYAGCCTSPSASASPVPPVLWHLCRAPKSKAGHKARPRFTLG